MIEFFLSSSLSCGDARILINKLEKRRTDMGDHVVNELIYEVKNHVPECFNERSVQHR
jgi:hypothetical protein